MKGFSTSPDLATPPDLNPIEKMFSKLKAYLPVPRPGRSKRCTRPSATPCGP
jgi:hypothetical protein